MLQMPISDVISKIGEHSGLSDDDIKGKIKAKLDSLNGLVSEEGAAYIIANELGVKLFEKQTNSKELQIKDILAGMKSVDTMGKVTRIFETRTFTKDGAESKVGNFIIADETGPMRIVLWDTQRIKLIEDGSIKEGDVVSIKNGYVRTNKFQGGSKEIHLGLRGQLVLEEGVEINVEVPKKTEEGDGRSPAQEVRIIDAKPGGNYKISGTIVKGYSPFIYQSCGDCGKKARDEAGKFTCAEHGEVTPQPAMVLNFVVDDGTENIRCTAFRETAENLLGSKASDLQDMTDEDKEQKTYDALAGIEVDVEGFVKENTQFSRIEMSVNKVTNVNPLIIVQKLMKGGGQNS